MNWRVGLCLSALVPLAVDAQELRPVPDYFAEAIFASSMASSLADYCGAVAVNADAFAEKRTELLAQLAEDGFDPDTAMAQMMDPTGQVHALQSAFLEKYPLEASTQAQVCTAALSEMGRGTLIGSLLVEVGK